jgi:L-ascorbate metabolism protein UlaG (beta-lactamase superfamily)
MIVPVLKDAAFLSDVRSADVRDEHFRLWWLGQSGFLVQYEGRHILLDPYLSDSLTRKYASTGKPHVRMTERVVDPAELDFIDAVTSSHNHTDHLDAETLGPLMKANPGITLICPEANRPFVADRLKCAVDWPRGLREGEQAVVGAFRFTAVPAAHEEVGPEYAGYVIEFARWRIYHSGDTMLFEWMADRLKPFHVDVAILPINGRAPERRVAGNLNSREAAELGAAIGARTVIPCHYEMFTFNTADPREFADAAASIGQSTDILRAGERWDSRRL